MMKKLTFPVIACLVTMLFMAGCGKEEESQSAKVEPGHAEMASQPAEDDSFKKYGQEFKGKIAKSY